MKPKAGDIKKQVQKQDDLVYGEDPVMNDDQEAVDIDEQYKTVFGNAKSDSSPLNIAEDINEDEMDAGGWTTPKRARELIKEDKKKAA